ncbi:MAG: PAS domain-containing protein [Deltaproteobacteria bacterium]
MDKNVQDELNTLNERIKECRQIEQSLRESEARFRTLVEQIPAITYISALDKDGTILYVSPQIRDILGYSPDEYKADPDLWRKQLHPDDHDRVMADLVSSRVADRNFVSEYRKIARDGHLVWFHDEAVTVKDNEGKALYLQGVMYDITQEKTAEKALENAFSELEKRVSQRTMDLNRINQSLRKEIEERSRAQAVASKLASFPILLPMPVVELDKDGRITYINPVGIRLFSDILTAGFNHPFLRGLENAVDKLREEDKQSLSREIEIAGVWYSQFVFLVENGLRLYAMDITERKKFEQALKENQRELLAIIEGTPILQFVLDREHRVLYWNKALERYTGIPSEKMVGTKDHCKAFYSYQRPCLVDLLLDNQIEDISRWYPDRFTKSRLVENAYEATDFFPKVGEHGTWLQFTAALILDSQGEVMGAIETMVDVTQQKKAEEERQHSEEIFRTVANFVYDWEYWLDPEKKLIYSTPSCQRFTGYTPDEFYANPGLIQKIVHPDDRKKFLDHIATVTEQQKEASIDIRIISKDGRVLWINHICHAARDDSGAYIGRRVSNTDITRVKQLESRLKTCADEHRIMLAGLPGAVFTGRQEGQELEPVGDGIQKLTGFEAKDFLSNRISYTSLVVDEDRPRLLSTRKSASDRNQEYEVSYRIKDAGGNIKKVLEKGLGTRDTAGRKLLEGVLLDAEICRQ